MAEINNTNFTPDAAIIIPGASNTNNSRISAIEARNLIIGTDGPDILFGTPGDDDIRALAADDLIFGTAGNDLIDGGSGFDTLDYTNLGQAITLLPRGVIGGGNSSGGIVDIQKIIGAPGQKNTIDGSSGEQATFDINLGANQLVVNNIPGRSPLNFVVENFVNVTGTQNQDTIIGSNVDNTLLGSGGNDSLFGELGNDTLVGGEGNDILQGSTNAVRSTIPERDILTGGGGVDKFILGDSSGSFYKNALGRDFAQITDFTFGEQIQLGTGDTYNIQRNRTGFNIFVVKESVQDLIARVTVTTGSTSSINSISGGLTGAVTNVGVDIAATPILGKLPEGNFTLGSGQTNGIFVAA